jgi:hypothetical protein
MRIFEEVPIPELSRQWLLDEHRTLHCVNSLMNKKLQENPDYTWNGYDKAKLRDRHRLISEEMIRRGYKHHYRSDIDEGCTIKDD